MTRRLLATLIAALLLNAATAMPADDGHQDAVDVIIVGAGIAGLSAAVDLAAQGAQVAVFDMNSQGSGHAILASGIAMVNTEKQRAAGIQDSTEQALKDWLAYSEDGNPEWLRFYADHSSAMVYDWLIELGVVFDNLVADDTNRSLPRFHYPDGEARDIVLPIYRKALSFPNLHFYFNTQVTDILSDGGRAIGVKTRNLRSGAAGDYHAAHIVLATGGMAGSLARIREHWPAHFPDDAALLAGGSHFAQGLGHDMAASLGAAQQHLNRHWFYPVGIPDPAAPDSGHGITLSGPRGLWLNDEGQRFINPLSSNKAILDVMTTLPEASFWLVFDDRVRSTLKPRTIKYRYDRSRYERELINNPKLVAKAASLSELAEKTGMPATTLSASIARFNTLLAEGNDRDFGRFPASFSGNVTMPAVPLKPITEPPFYAIRIRPSNAESMGGVVIDKGARVLSTQGQRIPGLYAAGELTGSMGMNGSKYRINGLYLGPSVMTGRLAAASILKALGDTRTGAIPPQITVQRPANSPYDAATMKARLKSPQNGYWHFESVHDVVLSRELSCDSCHSDAFPKRAALTHRERLAQTQVCTVCH